MEFSEAKKDVFSLREKEILNMLIQGKTSKGIAKELFISKETVNRNGSSPHFKIFSSSSLSPLIIKASKLSLTLLHLKITHLKNILFSCIYLKI